ncbi:MAG: cell filamentation protein Fic, partial [Bacilli bacterium]
MEENKLIIYKNKDGNIIVDAIYKDETLWLSQKGMSKVFDVNIPAISKHLNNIFSDEELEERVVV